MDIVSQLKSYKPQHDFFIGIDSDGTTFDTMEIKHKKAFIPIAIKVWHLDKIEKAYSEVGEFVNLYSNLRGINRFPGLLQIFEFLEERQDVIKSGVKLPDYSDLREFVNSGMPMSNASLRKFIEGRRSKFLFELLEWSLSGDELFTKYARGLKPFNYVSEALERAEKYADMMIVSSASGAGLKEDWDMGGIFRYMSLAAGQEAGDKRQQIECAVKEKYKNSNILLIGDAPSDMKAAKANNALFYPIKPGLEEASWARFYNEAIDRFTSGSYAGDYEDMLVSDFLKLLPEDKPWD